MDLNNTLSKILGNNQKYEEIQVDKKVVDEITKIAVNADPKEFMALLSGKIDDSILKITGLIFLPFEASENSAVMQIFMMPITTDAVGSVHSHPGPSAQPSQADLAFFSKNGLFHMIICQPYNQFTINGYDAFGTPVPFTVTDLHDEVEIKKYDEIDEEFFDEDLLKELKKLEEEESTDIIDHTLQTSNQSTNKEADVVDQEVTKKEEEVVEAEPQKEAIDPEVITQRPKTVSLQIEVGGQMVEKELPLPPDYEKGDDLVVDIRTDMTPGNSIDSIVLSTQKSKNQIKQRNINKRSKPKIPKADHKKFTEHIENIKDKIEQDKNKKQPTQLDNQDDITIDPSVKDKSPEDVEREIKELEEEIELLKEKNKRLKEE